MTLLAIIAEYGVPISQWGCLCQALLRRLIIDDCTTELAIITSNGFYKKYRNKQIVVFNCL